MNKRKRSRKIWDKTEDNRCAHCGKVCYCHKTVDHYVPQSKGGTSAYANLMPLCEKCNRERNSEPVNPWEYYKYAKRHAIIECIQYKKEFDLISTASF